ncbi:hypothetical protein HPB48_009720 [Haemaphysalis longicornis]|uniref:Uncharacterized protein n=1 Tax=Haemaphysalis longicornis TaxID=44386 RepID=A0A9J6GAD9_HAELO|nr:hypothetical protein HPB48_009720 [Haemaphysalis longicornis]
MLVELGKEMGLSGVESWAWVTDEEKDMRTQRAKEREQARMAAQAEHEREMARMGRVAVCADFRFVAIDVFYPNRFSTIFEVDYDTPYRYFVGQDVVDRKPKHSQCPASVPRHGAKNQEEAGKRVLPAIPVDGLENRQPTEVEPESSEDETMEAGGQASAGNDGKRGLDKTDEGEEEGAMATSEEPPLKTNPGRSSSSVKPRPSVVKRRGRPGTPAPATPSTQQPPPVSRAEEGSV